MVTRIAGFGWALGLGLLTTMTPAQAVTEAQMEVQRCIWRCMYNTPDWSGRNFKAYNQCTIDRCGSKRSNRKKRRRR